MGADMKIRVLFFAACRDVAGSDKTELEVKEGTTVSGLVKLVVEKHPKLTKMLSNLVLSLNLNYTDVKSSKVLSAGDEVAFIPPISGG